MMPARADPRGTPRASAPPAFGGAGADALLQRLEWTVLRRLDGLLQGDWRTVARGAGVDLADLREYQLHDDVRHIDWNVTARTQQPYVRQFHEDRDLTAWFLLDLSGSVDFGSGDPAESGRDLTAGVPRADDEHPPTRERCGVAVVRGVHHLARETGQSRDVGSDGPAPDPCRCYEHRGSEVAGIRAQEPGPVVPLCRVDPDPFADLDVEVPAVLHQVVAHLWTGGEVRQPVGHPETRQRRHRLEGVEPQAVVVLGPDVTGARLFEHDRIERASLELARHSESRRSRADDDDQRGPQ